MGHFLIAPADRHADVDRHCGHLSRYGFVTGFDQVVGGNRVIIHQRLNGSAVNVLTFDNGDFVAHTGSFFYGTSVGESGLKKFYDAFAPEAPSWRSCMGHFALLIYKDGVLHLMTDPLGSYHIYHNVQQDIFSSGFLGVAELIDDPKPDVAGIYEYVWNGATFGIKTVIQQVRLLPAPALVRFDRTAEIKVHPSLIDVRARVKTTDLKDAVNQQVIDLKSIFKQYAALLPRPFRTALSGGFDSRLILAALLDAGISPDLFVFGSDQSPDVRCAKDIAEKEKLPLRHVNKAEQSPPPPSEFSAQVERDYYVFDGLRYDGLFDAGEDFQDRISRHENDGIVLNGSVGEIYRNFFYLPDRAMPIRDVVRAFFSRFDPSLTTDAFDPESYAATLVADMQVALNTDMAMISRAEVEALYPLFRGRFWSARDASVNQRFGWMLYPFLEMSSVFGTPNIPFGLKQFGKLEAGMINALNPALAGYNSVYGGPFDRPLPLSHRLQTLATQVRPAWLRQYAYRLKRQKRDARPTVLSRAYLAEVLDTDAPRMNRYIKVGRVKDHEVYNRVMTLEYMFQRLRVP